MTKKKEKHEKIVYKYSFLQNLRFYWQVLKDFKSRSILVITAAIPLGLAAQCLSMYTTKIILDRMEFSDTFTEIAFVIIGLFLLNLVLEFFKVVTNAENGYCGEKTSSYFRVMMEKKTLRLDYEYLEDPATQELRGRAVNGVYNNLPGMLQGFVLNILQFLIFGGVLSALHPLLFIPVILLTFATVPVDRWYTRQYEKISEEEEKLSRKKWYFASMSQDFKTAKDIRLYGMQPHILSMAEQAAELYQTVRRKDQNMGFITALAGFLVTLVRDGAAYGFLIWRAVQGELSSGDFVLYFSAISQFGGWFQGMLSGIEGLRRNNISINHFREFLELPDRFNHGEGLPLPMDGTGLEITLRNLTYTYPGAEEATLQNINMTIGAGEKIALVGLNGAGKTTLVKLICGLLTPTEGEILVNGHPINAYNREEYYSRISAMFQKNAVLPISIAENIAVCGAADIDRDKLNRAVRLAGFEQKIASLPMGADTPLEKTIHADGTDLSGGELQRLLLARAIYKDARLLILDEPTSALDPLAENRIYQNYSTIAAGKTALFISHRLTTTRFCDRILYLGEGTILESGTHEDLMQRHGKYAELFELQCHYYKEEVTA